MKTKIKYGIVIGTGIIIFGILGVQAASVVPSNGVLYSNSNSTVTTVEGALNELYANYNSLLAKGDASASDILVGKKALVKGKEVTGTMPNKSGVLVGLSGYETVTVKPHPMDNSQGLVTIKNQYLDYGYFDSTTTFQTNIANLNASNIKAGVAVGQVNGNSSNSIVGTFTSDATASASNILSGKTAYVNGSKVTGTIASLAAKTYTPGTSNQTIAAGKYLSGAQTITGDADLTAANIKSGVNIFGITGTYAVTSTNAQYLGYGNTATVKTYDCTTISGYKNLTKDNFVIVPSGFASYTYSSPAATTKSFSYSYNASTGKLTVNQSELIVGTTVVTILYDTYYVPIKVVR